MAKSIPDAYAELINQLRSIQGLRNVPAYPLENPATFAYLEMGPVEAEYEGLTFNQPIGSVRFPFKVHVSRAQGLTKAVEELLPFVERLANLLMYSDNKKNLNGTVNSVEGLTCKMVSTAAGDSDTLAWECILAVKINVGQSDVI